MDTLSKYLSIERDHFQKLEFQEALNALDTDRLLTLQWCLSLQWSSVEDKSGLDNLTWWSEVVKTALESKSKKG